MRDLCHAAWLASTLALGGCEGPNDRQVASVVPLAPKPAPSAVASSYELARYASRGAGHSLWIRGPFLGFQSEDGKNRFVTSTPNRETIACGAASASGTLVAVHTERGSVALWNADGKLLGQITGDSRVNGCTDEDFEFHEATGRVLVRDDYKRARLVGADATGTLEPRQARDFFQASFSGDGSWIHGNVGGAVQVWDARSGKLVAELPATEAETRVAFADGLIAIERDAGTVALYRTGNFEELLAVPGHDPELRSSLLLVELPPSSDGTPTTVAYDLATLKQRWRAVGRTLDRRPGAGGPRSPEESKWAVGGVVNRGASRYAVLELSTGAALASWDASGYGCGDQWGWEAGTLVFIEGSLLTFWSKARGKTTHRLDCEGALDPIFSKDRKRVLGLNALWDVASRKPLARLQMLHGGVVYGFSRDERFAIGATSVGDEFVSSTVRWDLGSGSIVAHQRRAEQPQALVDAALWFVDETTLDELWLAQLVDADGHAQPLLLSRECWSSSAALPSSWRPPEHFPSRHCPGLSLGEGARAWSRLP